MKIFNLSGMLASIACTSLSLFSALASAQGVNVAMPIASNCPGGYHWEMASGFAQCVADPPPVPPTPPTPPASSYPYVYEASAFFFETTQKVRVTMQVNFATGGGGWTSAAYSTNDYTGSFLFPWGGDLSWFWGGGDPGKVAALDVPMQWFANQGCRVLSMDSSVQSIVTAAVAAAGGSPAGGQARPNYSGGLWVNYAACPSRVM